MAHLPPILTKLHELREVFDLGQRAVPLAEELFGFLHEIGPLLSEVNTSVRDSAGKMPQASNQLHSVTQATEMATVEILDIVDAVLDDLRELQRFLDGTEGHLAALDETDEGLIAALREQGVDAQTLGAVAQALTGKRGLRLAATFGAERARLDGIRERLNSIMMALQVQDITSQQLAAANHLIESVRSRMSTLVRRMQATELGHGALESAFDAPADPGTFDEHARFDRDHNRQAAIDALMGGDALDIDAMFAQAAAPTSAPAESFAPTPEPAPGAASADDIDALFGGGAASASDIDALFGGAGGDGQAPAPAAGPASQDDIDALFG